MGFFKNFSLFIPHSSFLFFYFERWICYETKVYLLRWIIRFFPFTFSSSCFLFLFRDLWIFHHFLWKEIRKEKPFIPIDPSCLHTTMENKVGGFYGGLEMAFHDDCLTLRCLFIEQIWMWREKKRFSIFMIKHRFILNFEHPRERERWPHCKKSSSIEIFVTIILSLLKTCFNKILFSI